MAVGPCGWRTMCLQSRRKLLLDKLEDLDSRFLGSVTIVYEGPTPKRFSSRKVKVFQMKVGLKDRELRPAPVLVRHARVSMMVETENVYKEECRR